MHCRPLFTRFFDILQPVQPGGTFLNKDSFSQQASDMLKDLLQSLPGEIEIFTQQGAHLLRIVQYADKEIHACPDFNIIRPIVGDDVRVPPRRSQRSQHANRDVLCSLAKFGRLRLG